MVSCGSGGEIAGASEAKNKIERMSVLPSSYCASRTRLSVGGFLS